MPSKFTEIDLSKLENRSLLVVDDNLSLHRDYNAVLCPDQRDEEELELDELEDLLLGDEAAERPQRRERNFKLQSAYQGEEAHQLVTRHLAKGIKYPLAFVDMRMPPGWDGLETIKKLRELDRNMRFIIVTAYSDYSEEEIEKELGPQPPVTIVYKPFDPVELYELTFGIVEDWNRRHATNR